MGSENTTASRAESASSHRLVPWYFSVLSPSGDFCVSFCCCTSDNTKMALPVNVQTGLLCTEAVSVWLAKRTALSFSFGSLRWSPCCWPSPPGVTRALTDSQNGRSPEQPPSCAFSASRISPAAHQNAQKDARSAAFKEERGCCVFPFRFILQSRKDASYPVVDGSQGKEAVN